MIIEKDNIKCESIFNDERTHRFVWKRVWAKDKPLACVIMLNPCLSDNLMLDETSKRVTNNIGRLESFGGVVVVNLFSKLTQKLDFKWNSNEDLNDSENDYYIKKAVDECKTVIIAWGKAYESNIRVAERADAVLEMLEPYKDRMYMISDGERQGIHPLTPTARKHWELVPFSPPVKETDEVVTE